MQTSCIEELFELGEALAGQRLLKADFCAQQCSKARIYVLLHAYIPCALLSEMS